MDMFASLPSVALAGILGISSSQALAANIVLNPGFEDGMSDWTFADSSGVERDGHTGTWSAYLNALVPNSIGSISQSFATVAGDLYAVSFFAKGNQVESGTLSVSFGGYAGYSETVAQGGYGPWRQSTFNVIAKDAAATLSFSGQIIGGTFDIDDVVVADLGPAPVPEPGSMVLMGLGCIFLLSKRKW